MGQYYGVSGDEADGVPLTIDGEAHFPLGDGVAFYTATGWERQATVTCVDGATRNVLWLEKGQHVGEGVDVHF